MCRLLLCVGDFDVREMVDAAVAMACGRTATHEGPVRVHPNGWGAVWSAPDAPHLRTHRDVRPIEESVGESPLIGLRSTFLAIHTRHATLPTNHGLEFTHPLERAGDFPWYFMHNGFMPTVYRRLGLPASRFDSLEYFDYIVPPGAEALDPVETLTRLRAVPTGGTSGNAIAVNLNAAYVVHWSPADNDRPIYFGMSRLDRPGATIVSSEIIPALGAVDRWTPLPTDHVLELPLPAAATASRPEGERQHVRV
ncbi:hypothetical protein AB0B39_12070 [Micromonospora sp. NPDC049114]|uniref:class II glutamine amidotransferase n=1 Tax=unclassified Micromonospora TaxID=2617518 RepID=UPI0033C5009C